MRVVQVIKTTQGAIWALEQAKWLHDHDVDIITVLPNTKAGLAEKYRAYGMPMVQADLSLPLLAPWKLFSRTKLYRDIVKTYKPDILHLHFLTNVLMGRIALKKFHTPRVFQVPGPLHLESAIYRNIEISSSNDNDYWIGACKKTCDIYRKSEIDKNHVFLGYYGGYGGRTCDEYDEDRGVLHNEFHVGSEKKLIGMISYFYKPKRYAFQRSGIKGHEDFINAIALVRKKRPELIGIIIGGPWENSKRYYNKVVSYAKSKCNDGIIFTGFRNDIKKIYRELSIVVHPSHSENLGGAAESLAARVPTITTNVGGFTDIVIDGETGYTVEPKSPKQLANAIIKMLDDPLKTELMALKGQQKVRDLLDMDTCGAHIFNIYRKILSSERGKHEQQAQSINNYSSV